MFKTLKCTKESDTIHLTGQLKKGAYVCVLPVCAGENHFTVTVLSEKLRLNHGSFDPDGGTCMAPPGPLFVMADKSHYHGTIIAFEGLWQRLSLLSMSLPIMVLCSIFL